MNMGVGGSEEGLGGGNRSKLIKISCVTKKNGTGLFLGDWSRGEREATKAEELLRGGLGGKPLRLFS